LAVNKQEQTDSQLEAVKTMERLVQRLQQTEDDITTIKAESKNIHLKSQKVPIRTTLI